MLIARPTYQKWLWDLKDQNLIKVLTGVRRVGKSTLLQMHADRIVAEGVPENRILILNFEDPDVYTLGDWKQIYDHIKVQLDPDHMNYVFLDEVQNVPVFERLVDGLFIKKNVDLYVTGSNSFFLSGELATLLTGRYVELEVLPYSYKEYLNATNYEAKQSKEQNPQNFTKIDTFADFLYSGGIPEYTSLTANKISNADSFISGLLSTIIEKDIFARNKIYNKAIFNKIIDFIFDSIGSPISSNSIRTTLKGQGLSVNNETISNYLEYLTDAMLLYKVPRFEIKGKGLLQTLDKYYLVDTAFRKVRLGKKPYDDLGHLLENVVFLELKRRFSNVYIGKIRENEVDFVVFDYDRNVRYFQIAYTAKDSVTLERELQPLKSIKDSYPKYLLTTDPLEFDDNGIRIMNIEKWLLGEVE